jgi:hypothetical protein
MKNMQTTTKNQQMIDSLFEGLKALYVNQISHFEPFLATNFYTEVVDKTVDISLYDHQKSAMTVVIEICRKADFEKKKKQLLALLANQEYTIEEGFIYNVESSVWYCYQKNTKDYLQRDSYSLLLDTDLNTLVKDE